MRGGWVYFVLCKDGPPPSGLVKVGLATNPYTRLSELQTGCPYELEIVALCKGSAMVENRVHRALSTFRVRREWFALGDAWSAAEAIEIERGDEAEAEDIVAAILSHPSIEEALA